MTFASAGVLVLLGLLPSLVWMFFFLHKDLHPEPKYLVTKTFLMGIILSPIAVALQLGFTRVVHFIPTPLNMFVADGSLFFLWAALVEELIKFLAVYFIAVRDPQFDEPVDAMIYMMMAGLGFAAIENILVLFRTIPDGVNTALTVWALRFVGATLLHALASGLMGYFLALSWFFRHHRAKLIIVGLLIATLFHFTFNTFLAGNAGKLHGLGFATGLLCLMLFFVFVLFDRIKRRSPNGDGTIQLTAAQERTLETA